VSDERTIVIRDVPIATAEGLLFGINEEFGVSATADLKDGSVADLSIARIEPDREVAIILWSKGFAAGFKRGRR
jgi:hypothetical protein